MSYKPIDIKRDQFRQYLEQCGVTEMLTKVFVQLLETPDKPDNPIDFICNNLGQTTKENDELQTLRKEISFYQHENEELKKKVEELRGKIIFRNYRDNNTNTNTNTTNNNNNNNNNEVSTTQNESEVEDINNKLEGDDNDVNEVSSGVGGVAPDDYDDDDNNVSTTNVDTPENKTIERSSIVDNKVNDGNDHIGEGTSIGSTAALATETRKVTNDKIVIETQIDDTKEIKSVSGDAGAAANASTSVINPFNPENRIAESQKVEN